MGRNKQSHPAGRAKQAAGPATSSVAASQPAPSATPAHADTLADGLADLALQHEPAAATSKAAPSQQPAPTASSTPSPTTSSSAVASAAGSQAPRRTTRWRGAPAPAEFQGVWDQMVKLHDTQGMGYLAGFVQASPDLRARRDSGDRDGAFLMATDRLCGAAQYHADTQCLDTAIAVLQAAHRESITTLSLEHDATLVLSLKLANILLQTGQLEQSARQARWLIPRAARLPGGWSDGCQLRILAAKSLFQIGRPAEAGPIAYEAYVISRRLYGDTDEVTIDAANVALHCQRKVKFLPPADQLPLLQLHLREVKQTNSGITDSVRMGDEAHKREIWKAYKMLQFAYKESRDYVTAEKTSRAWIAEAKTMFGSSHPLYLEALHIHALNLTHIKKYEKAVSYLTSILSQHMAARGTDHEDTVFAAEALGSALLQAGKYDTAAEVLGKAWEAAKRTFAPDDEALPQCVNLYLKALIGARQLQKQLSVLAEAHARGYEVWAR